jgi:hypothetical protein
MDDETVWRKRLLLYSLVRFGGLAVFFLGLAIVYTDLVRAGGWPQLGAVIAILGVIDALLAPHMLKKLWKDRDLPQP